MVFSESDRTLCVRYRIKPASQKSEVNSRVLAQEPNTLPFLDKPNEKSKEEPDHAEDNHYAYDANENPNRDYHSVLPGRVRERDVPIM
jgi:hypothetical protein